MRQFLCDPRVMDMPAVWRWFVVTFGILPFRARKSAHAYSRIWSAQGSPLLAISGRMAAGLRECLANAEIELGMRYGKPSIEEGLQGLVEHGIARLIVAPLFPQYSSAATGSALERVYRLAGRYWNVPPLSVLPPFYSAPEFLEAWVSVSKPVLDEFQPDHVLFSLHGLPERHIRKGDPTGRWCLMQPGCCDAIPPENRYCYRAQCLATARELAKRLRLSEGGFSIGFQSQVGRSRWLQPATDALIPELARDKGVRRLVVLCPSFVTDCLETLEQIGLRGQESFLAAGGEAFRVVPCLNEHPAWLDGLAAMLSRL
jgi:ferrochelatase